jgi:O-antigen ligase
LSWSLFAKTPLFWSILLLFGVAFNFHVPDLGETYVSRNISAWGVICLSLILLWWRPFKKRVIEWSPLWLAGLFLPSIGSLFVLVVNILGPFEHMHVGHYFLPLMLLSFGLFVLGLLQHSDNMPDLGLVIIAIFIAFMPQYGVYLAFENPLFGYVLPFSGLSFSSLFTKASAGFGQYNLLGSFMATLLVLAAAAFAMTPMTPLRRLGLALIIVLISVDLPFVQSKTALLGVILGLSALGLHIYLTGAHRQALRRYGLASAVVLLTYVGTVWLSSLLGFEVKLAARDLAANQSSFSTRYTMWVIGFWGFTEKPLFGHGLGAYLSVYMDHFGRYGLAEGLSFYRLVSIPHNLFIHILSESGLFGLIAITGPFIFLGLRVFGQSDNRWFIVALLAPILLHSQLEYPYIASGAHYWLFGVILVLGLIGPSNKPIDLKQTVLPHRNSARMAFAGLTAYVFLGVTLAVILTADVRRATLDFAKSNLLPLEQFIADRATAPTLNHPILGERLRAITNLQAINKIFAEQRPELLRPLALPYFEAHVLERYPSPPIWEMAVKVYVTLGEDEKLEALIEYIALYTPDRAAQLRAEYKVYQSRKANRPQ